MKIKVAALALACALPLHAQLTQTHAPSTVVQSNVMAPGINLGTINYYNDGQVLKNIVGAINPGFEPALSQQIQVVNTTGTSSSWTDPNKYAIVPANYWAGGTATVVHSQSGNTTGCSSTIASNTGPNYPTETNTAAVYTLSAPCAGAFSTGDTIVIKRHLASTPETQMESSAGGFWSNISSGGKLLGETTDLCATCGQQALDMQAASGTAAATFYWDTSPAQNLFRLLNGTYVISYDAKAASGSPTLSVSASRPGTNAFSSGTFTPSLTSSWQHFTHTFTASEVGIWSGNSNCVAGGVTTACTTQTAGQNARLVLSATGGEVYLDNVSLAPASSTNPTIFTDNFVAALTNLHPGTLRYWLGQNGEDAANWLAPDYARSPSGPGFWVGPVSIGNVTYPSLQDFLALAQTVGAQPYVEIPVTISNSDAACVVEFLAAATAGCAANRIALGQSTPWTSIFSNIHLAYCNECWNGSFAQQNLPSRSTAPSDSHGNPMYYYDYQSRAAQVFAAMRADAAYPSSGIDLVMGFQTAVNYTADDALAAAHPDTAEINGYSDSYVSLTDNDYDIWTPGYLEGYQRSNSPGDPGKFYASVHDYQSQNVCGPSGTAACKVSVYEYAPSNWAGSLSQAIQDSTNAGGGAGVIAAELSLENIQAYGITAQNYFAINEFSNNGVNKNLAKLWGLAVDFDGATHNKRPQYYAMQLVNQAILAGGQEYACLLSGTGATQSFAGNSSNGTTVPPGVVAISNAPLVTSYCFENGNQRTTVLVSLDTAASHSIGFAGTGFPTGSVAQTLYAPASPDLLNEAHTGSYTGTTAAPIALSTSTLSSPSSVTVPANGILALAWSVGSTQPTAAAPTFSPAAGTYSSTQSVMLTSSTFGSTIYYTLDGSTPTTSSAVYSSPISVSSSVTVKAIAVLGGYNNSAVSSAAYVINIPTAAAPTFSPVAGSYTSTQTVTLASSTTGATIYYTTNGTTPTTASAVYSAPLTVAASETIKAIAAATGYTTSSASAAAYTITAMPVAATPTLSPAPGTYTSAQTVTIATGTTGAAIYYTLDGSTPNTSSPLYSTPLTVSSSSTIKAIAFKTGYTHSLTGSAAYVINSSPTTGTCTVSGNITAGGALTIIFK